MSESLVINEIYLSLQGESTWAGFPCVFVRLTACNLRCSYCDTAYAFAEGKKMSLTDICSEVARLAKPFRSKPETRNPKQNENEPPVLEGSASSIPHPEAGQGTDRAVPSRWPLVELTGGEPLLQRNSLPLMRRLCDDAFTVLLETSGALDISGIDPRVRRIMDLKCPSSGEVERNRWENLLLLKATDELKFVIGTREDYAWAKQQIRAHGLERNCPLLFSWVHPLTSAQQHPSLRKVPAGLTPISRQELAEQIIADALPVRFQIQLHKVIWPGEARGV